MVFASLTFLYIFLPLNIILYYAWKNELYRNIILTVFSLVFYAWGEPLWVLLLMGTATIDYLNALFIKAYRHSHLAKIGLLSSIILNIGVLMAFKYSGFVVSNINAIFGTHFHVPEFALPVGISFYTFQALSYVFDVYTNKVKAQTSLLKFMMFISLYHQLVAGPIVRYETIAEEIDRRRERITDISAGIGRFCIGLFKKVCIANVAGQLGEKFLHGDLATMSSGEAWYGILMYTFQIYFDFSGYSDMAIGLGRMFGFHYLENFNYPYIARSAGDFWRRWHISLSTWFRDYIYIPLGGNKPTEFIPRAQGKHDTFLNRTRDTIAKFYYRRLGGSRWKSYRNLFIVWFLTGLWHGASWNFIYWGLFWGFLILIERMFLSRILNTLPRFFSHIYLLFAAMIGWTLFYFTDFNELRNYLQLMFGHTLNGFWSLRLQLEIKENMFWLAIAVILCIPVYKYANKWIKHHLAIRKRHYLFALSLVFNLVLLFLATSMLVGKSYNPFIYYRF